VDIRTGSISRRSEVGAELRRLTELAIQPRRSMTGAARARFRGLTLACTIAAMLLACGATYRSVADRVNMEGKLAYSHLLNRYQPADREVVRMRPDVRRERLWVLTPATLYIYDTAAATLLHRIQLPAWSMADFAYALPPDLVLDSRGVAYLSSNVEPRLLEIDPSTVQVKEHRLRLISRPHSESGFGALQFAPDGTLLAVGTTAGSRFRIDLRAGTAEEMR